MRYTLLFTFLIFCQIIINAQQLDIVRFNYENRFVTNPASILESPLSRISIQHQQAFTGINNAPALTFASIQLPLFEADMGLGIAISSQSLGIIRDSRLSLAYAYKLKLSRFNGPFVSLGIGAHLNQLSIFGNDITPSVDLRDPFLTTTSAAALKPDFSLGVMYSSAEEMKENQKTLFKIGASLYRLISHTQRIEQFNYNSKFAASVFGELQFRLYDGSLISILSNTHIHRVERVLSSLSLRGQFSETIILGLSYDTSNFAALEVGVQPKDEFTIIASGGIPLGSGGRQLGLGYSLKLYYTY